MRTVSSVSHRLTVVGGVVALCAGLLVPTAAHAAPSAPASAASSAVSAPLSPEKAEAVFLALFFMQGDEALALYEHDAISQLDGFGDVYAAVNAPEARAVSASVVADLRASDPEYFTRFASSVASGNPFVVEEQIAQSRADISGTATIAALADQDAATYVPGEMGPTCGVTVVVGAAFVLAVAVFAAAGAVIWVAAAGGQVVAVAETAVEVRNVQRAAQGDQLYQDWIADVTTTYAGA